MHFLHLYMHFKFWAVTFSFIFTKLQFWKKRSVFSLWILEMGFFSYKTCMELKDYLSMKQGSLFCLVMSCWEPWCFMLRCSYLWKALNEWGGDGGGGLHTALVWDCLELWCRSSWLLNHFLNENSIKSKLN